MDVSDDVVLCNVFDALDLDHDGKLTYSDLISKLDSNVIKELLSNESL